MELLKFIQIILLILVQGGYDFIGWKIILGGSDSGKFSEKVFRIIKFLLDFPVTIWFALVWLQFGYIDLAWFYFLKWLHSCDRVYNWSDKLIYKQEPAYWGYWRWWTLPLGILRTNWFGIIHIIKGYTYEDYLLRQGHFKDLPVNDNTYDWQIADTKWKEHRGMVNILELNNINNVGYILLGIYYLTKFIVGVI